MTPGSAVLADTSAWALSRRTDQPELRREFDRELLAGRIVTCDMVRLELLYSALNPRRYARTAEELAVVGDCPIDRLCWTRALEVYGELAAQGGLHQRQVTHADLLIAAAAEAAGVPVLHYDDDFERIAAITGQEHRWIVPRGSI